MRIYTDIPEIIAILTSLIVALLIVFVLYYLADKPNSLLTKQQKIVASLFRFLAVFIIVFLFFDPHIKINTEKIIKPVIIFAQDNSKSIIANRDTFFRNVYNKSLNELFVKLKKQKDVNIKFVTFGNIPKENDSLTFDDKITNFSKLFSYVNNAYKNDNVKLMVIASDGIINNGINPLFSDFPSKFKVHTLLIGDTTHYPDIKIDDIEYNNIVLSESSTPLIVTIRAINSKDSIVTLFVKEEDKTLFSQKIKINSNNFLKKINYNISPSSKGIHTYTVIINGLKNEKNKSNNKKTIKIDVINATQNILILADAPHPDIGAISYALSQNLNFKVTKKFAWNKIDSLNKYNLIILHNLPSKKISATEVFNEAYKRKIPILFILGTKIDLKRFNKIQNVLTIKTNIETFEEVTPAFNNKFQTFTIKDCPQICDKLPPLKLFFGEYNLNPSFDIIFYQKIKNIESEKPLIALGSIQNMKVGIIMGENIWRWKTYNYLYEKNFDFFVSLINNITKFLALKVKKDNLNISVNKLIKQYEPIIFNAQFFNNVYENINSPDLTLEITSKDDSIKRGYIFTRTENGYKLKIESLPPGDYLYKATLNYNGKKIEKKGYFSIEAVNLESLNTIANPIFLKKLASKYGGTMFYSTDSLLNNIIEDNTITSTIKVIEKTKPIISFLLVLFLIVLFLTAEWLAKKLWGSI